MDRRKELKQSYKMAERPMGIYQIRNLLNGKIYIGKSENLDGAFNSSRFQLKYGLHKNKSLQDDWKSFGEKNFVFEILQQVKSSDESVLNIKDELKRLEILWLEKSAPYGEKEY
jgi:hypothetical protein